jgi:LytS/YehU family sensor histidine kinase
MTLLPVIENVSKHNEISSKNPMIVNISVTGGSLVVTNKKKGRIDAVVSEGIGLSNLNNRYTILTGKEITVVNEDDIFSVSLPIIEEGK